MSGIKNEKITITCHCAQVLLLYKELIIPQRMADKIYKKIGLTFDDVLLAPAYTDVAPHEANISARLTKNIFLNIPIMSAAMDTVTEDAMAVAMARGGGIGVIHRNLTVDAQAEAVRRVKRAESEMIISPISLTPQHTLRDASRVMRRYNISGIPIVESKDSAKLMGIITSRDLRFEDDLAVAIADKMRKGDELIYAQVGITSSAARQILRQHKIEKLPIIDEEGNLYALITMKDILREQEYPISLKDKQGRLRVAAAIGTGDEGLHRAEALIDAGVDVIVLDTAHGYAQRVLSTFNDIRENYPDCEVIVGNIATPKAAAALAEAGVDAIKIGVGPGSICTTRVISGVGVPQITAIIEIADALRGSDVPLIADGGLKYSGDITKALAAGADCVMLGGMLAGAEEAPGEKIIHKGRAYKTYRGMGSDAAIETRSGADRYSQEGMRKVVPEGVEGRVPYKGFLAEILEQFTGGLRVGMAYCGARTIDELQNNSTFIQITPASLIESHPHDVIITKESRNYSRE